MTVPHGKLRLNSLTSDVIDCGVLTTDDVVTDVYTVTEQLNFYPAPERLAGAPIIFAPETIDYSASLGIKCAEFNDENNPAEVRHVIDWNGISICSDTQAGYPLDVHGAIKCSDTIITKSIYHESTGLDIMPFVLDLHANTTPLYNVTQGIYGPLGINVVAGSETKHIVSSTAMVYYSAENSVLAEGDMAVGSDTIGGSPYHLGTHYYLINNKSPHGVLLAGANDNDVILELNGGAVSDNTIYVRLFIQVSKTPF